ncbi:MAG: DNA repair protein RadC [Ignavibacteriales bacterium]|nr:DNA repair protein RadC [Ignavibacteriales bacterium]
MKRGNQKIFEASFYHTTIKQWPKGEQPREKLIRIGASALSEAELMAILFRTGGRGATAVDLAQKLLAGKRTLKDLSRCSVSDLEHGGLGTVRAVTLVAAFELARRLSSGGSDRNPIVRSPEDVVGRYGPMLRDLNHEEFWVLLLSSSNRVFRELRVSSGTLNSSLVHPRECFSEAIKQKAASVVFVHNHPSGNPEPSQEDLAITRQLAEAGKILGIPVHDHIIIADDGSCSFAERGLI